jgi:Tol biopolymer transport system component
LIASGDGPGEAGETKAVWVIPILTAVPRQIRGNADFAVVSPDGRQIAFRTTKDGHQLWVMGANGEDARMLLKAESGVRFGRLQWSPDSRSLAYLRYHSDAQKYEVAIVAHNLQTGKDEVLVPDFGLGSFGWVADGRIIFSRAEAGFRQAESNLWELPVDTSTGKVEGEPRRLTRWAGFSFRDFSATADGKRLVFVRQHQQTDVYVAQLLSQGGELVTVKRLTFDLAQDQPTAWTPDGRSVLFHSDRNGTRDIFRQDPAQAAPDELVIGVQEQYESRLTPDGAALLYWDHPRLAEGYPPSIRLLRTPLAGGTTSTVLEARWGAQFRCARAPNSCVLSEPSADGRRLEFSVFDPVQGKQDTLSSVDLYPEGNPRWDISPDGQTAAIVDSERENRRARLVNLRSGEQQHTEATPARISDVAWLPDGRGLLVATTHARGSSLFELGLKGEVREIWQAATQISRPVPSPDQKGFAFALSTLDSNAWVVEGY